MKRRYVAWADNGDNFFEFEFFSEHRANSKANYEDAIRQWKSKHGRRSVCVIKQTFLNPF